MSRKKPAAGRADNRAAQRPAQPQASSPAPVGRLRAYGQLTRLNRPIGTLLLLWPTLWALWLAAEGVPEPKLLLIFIGGVALMRAAGCAVNDFADRKIDGHVKRTRGRPLVTGAVSAAEAVIIFVVLSALAFALVLQTNTLTIKLSLVAVALAACYPFAKRYTHLPQVVLGAAFAWSIPMAFAATLERVPEEVWPLYIAVVLWTVVYDTFYAMVDRDDDLKVGIKSTAILFGEYDRHATAALQVLTLVALLMVGARFELGLYYYGGLGLAALIFAWQQWLIIPRYRKDCFRAFLSNQWVGAVIFAGIVLHYYIGGR